MNLSVKRVKNPFGSAGNATLTCAKLLAIVSGLNSPE